MNRPGIKLIREIIDKARDNGGFGTYTALAARIRCSKVDISQFKSGKVRINTWRILLLIKLADLDRIKYYQKLLDSGYPLDRDALIVISDILDQVE